eukprot:gnl/TRDRNA2_/TRDRNA2_82994_c0_seq1.p1 gnl/TRDRNA2_/TRDRNA2_82994_c0~~gnl/TRDRNA2_/TRDRNA2_82994_c0_seq1.p1  ORF type:complete len:315 (-),score=29.01 gnl/TRDRNA2_/TRDRNA2_82994_c0_seq1:157-1101(-)
MVQRQLCESHGSVRDLSSGCTEPLLQEVLRGSGRWKPVSLLFGLCLAVLVGILSRIRGRHRHDLVSLLPAVSMAALHGVTFPENYTDQLAALWSSASRFDNVDVHRFNRKWANPNCQKIEALYDTVYGAKFRDFLAAEHAVVGGADATLSPSVYFRAEALNTFCHLVRSHCARNVSSASLDRAFRNLNEYLQAENGALRRWQDTESGVTDVFLWLWRIFFLGTLVDNRFNYTYEEPSGKLVNGTGTDFVMWSLCENAETNGGCPQGFAGRCVRDLLVLMVAGRTGVQDGQKRAREVENGTRSDEGENSKHRLCK